MESNDYFHNNYIIFHIYFHFVYSLGMQGSFSPDTDGRLFFLSDPFLFPQHQVNWIGTCLSKRQQNPKNPPRTVDPLPLPAKKIEKHFFTIEESVTNEHLLLRFCDYIFKVYIDSTILPPEIRSIFMHQQQR